MKRLCLSFLAAAFAWTLPAASSAQLTDAIKNWTRSATEAPKQIAYFRIKGPLVETPVNIPPLFGSEPPLSLKGLLERLKEARQDPNVVCVVLDVQESGFGMAQLQEFHDAVRKFAAVDKQVYVHSDTLTTLTYAAATAGSHVSVVPTGDIWLTGLYGETPYLRGALDKLGCVPDFETCGTHKTAAESLTRTEPSKEQQEMIKWLIDDIYDNLVQLMADARGIAPDKMRELIDNGPYSAEDALKHGLIDSIKSRQDFAAEIRSRFGDSVEIVSDYGEANEMDIPSDNIFALFEFLMKVMNPQPKTYTEPSVAVVYVEGPIMVGSAEPSPFGSADGAFSTTIRRALDEAAEEDTVKAVVLRVDSPGGSALASEIILDASRRVADKKPLVVSMGDVAGSGGYYVTCAASTIFADKSTITASIGVVAGKIVTTAMWEKIGVNWHSIQRGDMAGLLSSADRFSDAERAKLRHYMETVYEVFKGHVTAARGDKLTKPLEEIAGGRVFTGTQALELGLVDKIGGLDDAIRFAASRADLGEYEIRVIPEPPSIFDLFMGDRGDTDELARTATRATTSLFDAPLFQSLLPFVSQLDPLRAQAMYSALVRLQLLHDEHVITMMPFDVVIR
jgi:protease-4